MSKMRCCSQPGGHLSCRSLQTLLDAVPYKSRMDVLGSTWQHLCSIFQTEADASDDKEDAGIHRVHTISVAAAIGPQVFDLSFPDCILAWQLLPPWTNFALCREVGSLPLHDNTLQALVLCEDEAVDAASSQNLLPGP